jgi:hypothetical protein
MADEDDSMSKKPIDLSQEDGKPHWLSKEGRYDVRPNFNWDPMREGC